MKTNNSGQVLVEIITAFLLMTFLLSGLIVAGLFAVKNAQYSRNRSMATKLASQQIERARVVRDVDGIDAVLVCGSSCYISSDLTLTTPTPFNNISVYLKVETGSADCKFAENKIISTAKWGDANPLITPAKQVTVETCLSD